MCLFSLETLLLQYPHLLQLLLSNMDSIGVRFVFSLHFHYFKFSVQLVLLHQSGKKVRKNCKRLIFSKVEMLLKSKSANIVIGQLICWTHLSRRCGVTKSVWSNRFHPCDDILDKMPINILSPGTYSAHNHQPCRQDHDHHNHHHCQTLEGTQ